MNVLLDFYRGQGRDDQGRTLDYILEQNYDWLEYTHDYIQWLFPLPQPSPFNPGAPLLDQDTIAAFRVERALRLRLLASLQRMLEFYGFEYELVDSSAPDIWRGEHFAQRAHTWLMPHNHNYRRISRILQCLCLLGLDTCARAWFDTLSQVYRQAGGKIGAESYRYWEQAVGACVKL